MNTWKKLLSMLLVLAMLLVGPMMTGLSRAVAEGDTTEEPAPSKGRVLETEDLDPSILNIKKLGSVEENPELKPGKAPEEIDPEKIVRVSIFLEGKSTIDEGFSTKNIAHDTRAMDYRRSLNLQQKTMQTKIEGAIGHDLDVQWNLTLLVNAVSANIPYKDIETIKKIPGVKSVVLEKRYSADKTAAETDTSFTSEQMVGATSAWAAGYTGAGSKVAIIDTGIDATHQSFNADAFMHSIEGVRAGGKAVTLMEQIDEETLSQLNAKIRMPALTATETYLNEKIPFAFNYVDKNTVTDHVHDMQGNHGSHVAGIAAANRYISIDGEFKEAAAEAYAIGMAPDAQLLVMKVFGNEDGPYESDEVAPIEDAIILGCDVANLSLGAPQGFSYSDGDGEEQAEGYARVWKALAEDKIGMVVAISQGNSGAWTDQMNTELYIEDVNMQTNGNPGSYINSLTVASADNVGDTGTPMKFGDRNIFYWESLGSESYGAYGNPYLSTIAGTHEFIYLDCPGSSESYESVNAVIPLEGKVLIVNRGNNYSFFKKGNDAIPYNPKAVLVANHQPGQIGMALEGFLGDFPMVAFSLEDARAIKAGSTETKDASFIYYLRDDNGEIIEDADPVEFSVYTGSIIIPGSIDIVTEQTGEREEATISDFSSWGTMGSLVLKPDIAAPGGNIWSVNGTTPIEGGSDQYVTMSGTSMAAPHIAGLSAIVAQYLRENPLENKMLTEKYSTRAIVQSLLMSTATPMMDGENYYSLLQQGAGLVEVDKAITAPSVVMMDDAYLTTDTGAAADGKVKVELGDDPEKTGEYMYRFTIYNTSDVALAYELKSEDTKIFTQNVIHLTSEDFGYTAELVGSDSPLLGIDNDFMDRATVAVDSTATYSYSEDDRHDVNKDGMTDADDAQAILDYLTGVVDGATLNLEAGEMDGDGKITSYDAELLLHFAPIEGKVVVPAHGSKQVTVKIKLNDTFEDYPNGAYIEGFTYVTGTAVDEEGVDYAHEHTIPIFGFYGNWTDPSMFDNASYLEEYYKTTNKIPYSEYSTNYITYKEQKKKNEYAVLGNPYMKDDAFYADRLALNSEKIIGSVVYNPIRNAGTVGYAISKVNGYGGEVTEVLDSAITGNWSYGLFYYVNADRWYNDTPETCEINKKVSELGLSEGDTIRAGFYMLPELTAMKTKDDLTDIFGGIITDEDTFADVIESNTLGKGACVAYDFIIDNTAPELGEITFNKETNEITVPVVDNEHIAYVALLNKEGYYGFVEDPELQYYLYGEENPGTAEATVVFDATDALTEMHTEDFVLILAADYAGNETLKSVKIKDYVDKTYYVKTDELAEGNKYYITDTNQIGDAVILKAVTKKTGVGSSSYYIPTGSVEAFGAVVSDGIEDTELVPYIEPNSNPTGGGLVWSFADGKLFGRYKRSAAQTATFYLRQNDGALVVSMEDTNDVWTWNAENHQLSTTDASGEEEKTYYLSYNEETGAFELSENASSVYLFKEINTFLPPQDPTKVEWIEFIPYDGTNDEYDEEFDGYVYNIGLVEGTTYDKLTVWINPLTANQEIAWSSADESIATVDEYGAITGVTPGTTYVIAASVEDPEVIQAFKVTVLKLEDFDSNAVAWDVVDGRVGFYLSEFNTDNPADITYLHEQPLHELASSSSSLYGAVRANNEEEESELFLTTFYDTQTAPEVYKVNEDDYSLIQIEDTAGDGLPPFDIAPYIGANRAMMCYGPYLILTNVLPEEEMGCFSDVDLAFKPSGDSYAMCVAATPYFFSYEAYPDYGTFGGYYWITEEGTVYLNVFSDEGYSWTSSEKLMETGITPSLEDSLYCVNSSDGEQEYLLWTHFEENKVELIILEPNLGVIVHRDFGDRQLPVLGLYTDSDPAEAFVVSEDGNDKDATVGRVVSMRKEIKHCALEKMSIAALKASVDRIQSKQINDSTETNAPLTIPGGTNALRGTYEKKVHRQGETRKAGGSSSTSYPNVTITLSEDKASTNGFFTVKYDPKKLTYVSEEHITEYGSLYVDKTKGEIKFAYASMNEIAAKKTLATLKFKAQGQDTTVTVTTKERGSDVALNETSTIQVKGQQPKPATVEVKAADVEFNGKTPYRVYNGKAQTPGYIVKDEKGNVIPASKYKAEYKENVKAGTAYIFITFPNKDYKDCRTWFKIYLPATTWTKVENVENGIKISWTKVEGAAGYVVYRRAWNLKDKGWTTFERWNNTTGTSWIDTKVYAGTRYQYGVKAYFARRADAVTGAMIGGNVGDNYNLGIVGPLKTTVRITTRVLNSVTPGSKKLTVKWTGSSLFTGYQVQVATDAKFTKDVKTVTVDKAKTYEKAVTGLKAKTTYYVRVRSYHIFEGMTYYGQWSNVLNGKTK